MYFTTPCPKKGTNSILGITSSNTGRFSKFFQCHNLLEICNKTIIKFPTTPQMRCYTTTPCWEILRNSLRTPCIQLSYCRLHCAVTEKWGTHIMPHRPNSRKCGPFLIILSLSNSWMNCRKDGTRSTTSSKMCRHTALRKLNVQVHSYSFILARTTYTRYIKLVRMIN